MADVLLTHSYHLLYDRKQVRKMQPYPPLGTLYAACALRTEGIDVAVFDSMLQDPLAGFQDALERHHPKIVAIYEDDFNFLSKMCLTRMREVAWSMAQLASSKGALVIAHGSDATDHAEQYLLHGIDFVLLGEAEPALAELCATLLASGDTSGVCGLVYFDARGAMVRTPAKQDSTKWLSMPGPARDLIDLSPYREAWREAHGYFSLNLVASRGCPYHCNWCAKPISGNRFHVRPAKAVADELRELKQVHGADHAWFGDDVFALSHRWVMEFAQAMESNGCSLPFKIQSRADLMTRETVDALRRAGCAEVWMGVESGSQKVLDSMDKGLLVEEVITARENLRRSNIRAAYFLQLGYPGERWEDLQKTIALVRETRPDDIGVSLSYPLPNTPFFERVSAELGRKRNWTDSDDLCVIFKGAYTDDFYLAIRDALHAEVDSWRTATPSPMVTSEVLDLWNKVQKLEPVSRNSDPTVISSAPLSPKRVDFVSAHQIAQVREA